MLIAGYCRSVGAEMCGRSAVDMALLAVDRESGVRTRYGHGLGPSMGWVALGRVE